MRVMRSLAVLVICGCSHASNPTKPTAPACPSEDVLVEKVKQLFDVRAVEEPVCAAGFFPEPGWVVGARYNKPRGGMLPSLFQLAVIDAKTDRAVVTGEQEIPPGPVPAWYFGVRHLETHDFDGDGVDEVISLYVQDKKGFGKQQESLSVWRVTGATWAHALRRNVTYDDGATVCAASWKAESHTLVLTPKVQPVPNSDQCMRSSETWVLGADGTFVQR